MHFIGVLDGNHVLTLPACEPDLGNRRRCVLKEPGLVFRIGPSLGDDLGAVVRADFGFIHLDQDIERLRVHIAFLKQYGFECPYAQLHIREMRTMIMIVLVVHVTPPFNRPG